MNLSNEVWLYILGAITAAIGWTAKLLVKIFKRMSIELKELREENQDLAVENAKITERNIAIKERLEKKLPKSRGRIKD